MGPSNALQLREKLSGTRWRRPWFRALNASSLMYPGLYFFLPDKELTNNCRFTQEAVREITDNRPKAEPI